MASALELDKPITLRRSCADNHCHHDRFIACLQHQLLRCVPNGTDSRSRCTAYGMRQHNRRETMSATQNSHFYGSPLRNRSPQALLLLAAGVGRAQIRADAGGEEREGVLPCSEPEAEGVCSTVPFPKPIGSPGNGTGTQAARPDTPVPIIVQRALLGGMQRNTTTVPSPAESRPA